MNNTIHDHLNKLRLISKLKEGQSLDTTNDLSVYEFTYLNWFWRKWRGDNKEEVTRFLQEFYRSVDQSTEQLINEIKNCKEEQKKNKYIKVSINLAEKLKDSIHGLEILSKTYNNYPKTIAIIEGIIQDFAISTYSQLLEIIPQNKYGRELSSNVTYHGNIIYMGIENKDVECAED